MNLFASGICSLFISVTMASTMRTRLGHIRRQQEQHHHHRFSNKISSASGGGQFENHIVRRRDVSALFQHENRQNFQDHDDSSAEIHRYLGESIEFQIKQYWVEGMSWQESTMKFSWCAECEENGDGCLLDGWVRIRECDDRETKQRWLYNSDDQKIRSSLNPQFCMTYSRPQETIKIKLQRCTNDRDKRQRWEGFSRDGKFQLHPQGHDHLCVTQEHHPRKGERLKLQKVRMAENNDPGVNDDTSHWIIGRFDGHDSENKWLPPDVDDIKGEMVQGVEDDDNCKIPFQLADNSGLCMIADRDELSVHFRDCKKGKQDWFYNNEGQIQNKVFGEDYCLVVGDGDRLRMAPCSSSSNNSFLWNPPPRWTYLGDTNIQLGDTGECIDVWRSVGNIATVHRCKEGDKDQAFDMIRCQSSSKQDENAEVKHMPPKNHHHGSDCKDSLRLRKKIDSTDLCMVVDRDHKNHRVSFVDCDTTNQKWHYTQDGYLQNDLLGKEYCLKADKHLYMVRCKDIPEQTWTFRKQDSADDGDLRILSEHSNECIDINRSAGDIATVLSCKQDRKDDQAFHVMKC